MPSLSVIIPTLNRPIPICQTVEWFLTKSAFADFELIVVDQSDNANQKLIDTTTEDRRLRYFNVAFKGTTLARNFGVRQAQSRVVVFSEDDVMPNEDYLYVYSSHFAYERSIGATGPVLAPGQRLRSLRELTPVELKWIVPNRHRLSCDVGFQHAAVFGAGGNSAYLREAVIELGGFDEAYIGNAWGEEYEFGHRFRKKFGEITYLPSASVVHLAWETGGSRTRTKHDYIHDFCRNAIYTKFRTEASVLEMACECWNCFRRFALNKNSFRHPSVSSSWSVLAGLLAGVLASRSKRRLPLSSGTNIPISRDSVEYQKKQAAVQPLRR